MAQLAKSPSGITTKIFLGFEIDSRLKAELNKSRDWKLIKTTHDSNKEKLEKVSDQNKSYIGKFATQERLTLKEIKKIEAVIKSTLQQYCPDADVDQLSLILLPQTFVS